MLQPGKRLTFKSRKGQWRKRALAHMKHMATALLVTDQGANEAAAKLSRMGVLGEKHLETAIELDFSYEMLHDICMVCHSIHNFGLAWALKLSLKAEGLYVSEYEEIRSVKEDYLQWTQHTRTTYNNIRDMIKGME